MFLDKKFTPITFFFKYFPSREQFNQTHIDFRLGTDNSATLMKMVVMIATKDIENEEIFVDYRLDPCIFLLLNADYILFKFDLSINKKKARITSWIKIKMANPY